MTSLVIRSVWSSIVHKAENTIGTIQLNTLTWIHVLPPPASCSPVASWLVKEDQEDRSTRSGGSGLLMFSLQPQLVSLWDCCCCGWARVLTPESSGCRTFPFSPEETVGIKNTLIFKMLQWIEWQSFSQKQHQIKRSICCRNNIFKSHLQNPTKQSCLIKVSTSPEISQNEIAKPKLASLLRCNRKHDHRREQTTDTNIQWSLSYHGSSVLRPTAKGKIHKVEVR